MNESLILCFFKNIEKKRKKINQNPNPNNLKFQGSDVVLFFMKTEEFPDCDLDLLIAKGKRIKMF